MPYCWGGELDDLQYYARDHFWQGGQLALSQVSHQGQPWLPQVYEGLEVARQGKIAHRHLQLLQDPIRYLLSPQKPFLLQEDLPKPRQEADLKPKDHAIRTSLLDKVQQEVRGGREETQGKIKSIHQGLH